MSKKSSEDASEAANSITISGSILQRLENGVSSNNDETTTATDDSWIDKLASMDAEHTRNNGLEISDVEKLIRDVSRFANPKSDQSCPADTGRAANCLRDNRGNTLACAPEVESYTKCIDKLLYDAVRKDLKDIRVGKKETFAETFERQYQL